MNAYDFLQWQLRGGVVIAVGYVLLTVGCRWLRIESPVARLVAVLLVLFAACCPASLPVNIAWYPPAEDSAAWADSDTMLFKPGGDAPPVGQKSTGSVKATTDSSGSTSEPTPTRTFALRRVPRHMFALLWLAGIGGIALLSLWRYLAVVRQASRALSTEPEWLWQWHEILRENAVRKWLPLRVTRTAGPLLGLLPRGYCLLVPHSYWQALAPRQRRTVLRHELEHYLRGDVPASCLVRLLAIPFWWHPLAWRLVALFEESTEWACDRAASGATDGVAFAQALEQLLQSNPLATPLALGRSAQTHPLVTRVRRVLDPVPPQDSFMKTTMFAAALGMAALVSLVQIRLVAQEKREATIESVKEDVQRMEARLEDLKSSAQQTANSSKTLEASVKEKVDALKALGENPSQISAEGLKRAELLKSGDEAKQLEALAGAEKLGDEGLLLCAHAAKEIDREAVRRKALAIITSLGNDGLAAVSIAYESLPAKERLFLINELAKQKDKIDSMIFARLAQDGEDENRIAALKTILSRPDPLVYLVLAVKENEEIGRAAFPLALSLKGEDLELFLFTFASKGPEDLLPQVVKKAGELKEKGYPTIATAYHRKTAESRTEIVRLFRKSTVPIEQRLVEEALKDEDTSLRSAAEAAKNE